MRKESSIYEDSSQETRLNATIADNTGVITIQNTDSNATTAPSSLALVTPSSSPSNNTTPVVRVSGVTNGATVTLYKDNVCTQQIATGTSSGTYIDLTSLTLNEGSYTFKAKSQNSGSSLSDCSTASLSFEVDTTAPSSPSSLSLNSPNSSPGSVSTPTITVSGVNSGDTIKVYLDNNCSTLAGQASAIANSVNITSSSLSEGSYQFYAKSFDPAGNTSTCSSAFVAYTYTSIPASVTTGLQVWLDASDASSFTLSASNVTQWNDKSGNSRHFLNSDPSTRPSKNGSGVQFTGQQFLKLDPGLDIETQGAIFIVYKIHTLSNGQASYLWRKNNSNSSESNVEFQAGAYLLELAS